MSSYKGQNLFGSGVSRIRMGGLKERHEVHEQAGADGLRVTTLGKGGKELVQEGTLVADVVDDLMGLVEAIEGAMDGNTGVLVDDMGRRFEDVLMIEFEPGNVRKVGIRIAVDYEVRYLQVG